MDSCPHNDEYECFSCADHRHWMEHPETVEGCRECKFRTIQVSTAVKSERKHKVDATREWNNSWERGIAMDDRGIPLRDANLDPIPIKTYAENRTKFDAERHRLAHHPDPFGVKTGS